MADLLTFVDIQTQTQASQQTSSTSNSNSESAPGVFDALITEYTATENSEIKTENLQPLLETEDANSNLMTFTGGKLFSNSVLDILTTEAPEVFEAEVAPENFLEQLKISLGKVKASQPEVFYDDEDINFNEKISQLLDIPEDEFNEIFAALPDDLKEEVKVLVDEISQAVEHGADVEELKPAIEKLSSVFAKSELKIKISEPEREHEIKNDKEENKIENQDLEINSANVAGLAAVPNVSNDFENDDVEQAPEKNFSLNDDVARQDSKPQRLTTQPQEVQNVEEKTQIKNPDDVKPTSNFENVIEQHNAERENQNFNGGMSENDSENQNPEQNFSQSRHQSRSRNDNRRISNDNSRVDNERQTSTRRTESRNDFQSFFEGVLNSRRASPTSSSETAQPLSLRENFGFNQSATIRGGLVNVVRFIRADGVQNANVVIDPPALGRISVELTSSSSGVEASIKVSSEQIRQLVQDQLTQLRMNLSEQGVQVAEFTVDVQQDNQQGSHSQNENQQDGQRNFIGGLEEEDDTEDFRIDLEDGLLYWVA
ncbi:MAG: flagellar hook-length control protein FliK [Synergistaceae bacterium]|nr:flagellar hook-length control protein FliK [Synergistaceae bacterium]